MKKIKILFKSVLFTGMVLCGISLFMKYQIRQTYKRLDDVKMVDVSQVEDGIYQEVEETAFVKVTVKVTVKDHRIIDLQLLRHENGNGYLAESMIPKMIEENTSEVDTVSGATMSSKTIQAAVRNALEKGRK